MGVQIQQRVIGGATMPEAELFGMEAAVLLQSVGQTLVDQVLECAHHHTGHRDGPVRADGCTHSFAFVHGAHVSLSPCLREYAVLPAVGVEQCQCTMQHLSSML